jgi:hypothetical protein
MNCLAIAKELSQASFHPSGLNQSDSDKKLMRNMYSVAMSNIKSNNLESWFGTVTNLSHEEVDPVINSSHEQVTNLKEDRTEVEENIGNCTYTHVLSSTAWTSSSNGKNNNTISTYSSS